MTWTPEKDEALCKQIILMEPFRFRPRTKESGNAWSQVADDLKQIKSLNMNVDQRAVRERYKILKSHFLQKMREEENGSGIAPPELSLRRSTPLKTRIKRKRLRKTGKQPKRCARNL